MGKEISGKGSGGGGSFRKPFGACQEKKILSCSFRAEGPPTLLTDERKKDLPET